MNDGNCDAAGRLWAGTITIRDEPDAGALYRLGPDLTVSVVIDSVSESNGIDWSPDDRLMYYVDSQTRRVDMFDFDANSGTFANQRPFVTFDEDDVLPDGLTVDADGFVWVACWNGGAVRRFGPDGTLDLVVGFPTRQITSCAFGGDGLPISMCPPRARVLRPSRSGKSPKQAQCLSVAPGRQAGRNDRFMVEAATASAGERSPRRGKSVKSGVDRIEPSPRHVRQANVASSRPDRRPENR